MRQQLRAQVSLLTKFKLKEQFGKLMTNDQVIDGKEKLRMTQEHTIETHLLE